MVRLEHENGSKSAAIAFLKRSLRMIVFFSSSWRRITLTRTVDNKVSVRCIAKTFASGKTEKLVYQTLAEVGLPSEKVRSTNLLTQPSGQIVKMISFRNLRTILLKWICSRSTSSTPFTRPSVPDLILMSCSVPCKLFRKFVLYQSVTFAPCPRKHEKVSPEE